jgi:hypothetical protein
MNRLIIIGSMLIFGAAIAGCNQAEPPAQVNREVSKAQADRNEKVADARQEGAQAIQRQEKDVTAERRDVNEAASQRNYEVAIAKADGDYKVATEKCNALDGSSQAACKDQAEAVHDVDKAKAELLKPRD